jgi:two-component system phosphate regulon sensor histidine kinase PhoR
MEIRRKFTLTIAAIFFGGVVLLTILLSILSKDYLYDLHRDKLIEEAHSIERALSLMPDTPDNFRSVLDSLAEGFQQDLLSRVTLMNDSGKVLADSDVDFADIDTVENHFNRPEVQQAINVGWGSARRLSATVNQRFLYVAVHDLNPPTEVSIVRLAMPIVQLEETLADLRTLIITGGFIMLVVTIIATWIIGNQIVKPLRNMSYTAKSIADGDYAARTRVSGTDELGELGNSLNEMASKIEGDIKQMRKLERVRTEFIGNTSHELKTPIASIKGYIETLLSGGLQDPDVNERFLHRALSNTDRLQMLVQDLVQISRIESGEMRMSIRYFNVLDLLEELHQDFMKQFKDAELDWQLEMPETPEIKVQGDKERLKQVFMNLITNALKYTEEGYVKVGVEEHESRVTLYVEDSGVGIPHEYQSRIFERFFRIDKDRSRAVGGTGLGLAIVKHIISAHNAHIRIESDGQTGSKFWFQLPK